MSHSGFGAFKTKAYFDLQEQSYYGELLRRIGEEQRHCSDDLSPHLLASCPNILLVSMRMKIVMVTMVAFMNGSQQQ